MKTAHLFQICYEDASKQALDPDFTPLENIPNERPDWFEYWPIRRTLNSGYFRDDDYIGFFSPKFGEKTNFSAKQVRNECDGRDDPILSFSPFFDQSAIYRNPFEQGEQHHPGLTEITQLFLERCGLDLDLKTLISDHTTTIFANYFVAKYWVWREWFALSESLFALCEQADDELGRRLLDQTVHRHGQYPMKVFVMERLITVLMEIRGWAARIVALARATCQRLLHVISKSCPFAPRECHRVACHSR